MTTTRELDAARPSDVDLAREARQLAQYILGQPCPPDMAERYVQAMRALDVDGANPSARGTAVARFAFDHPASLPILDAAAGLTGAAPALRDRLHVMAAILEASPRFVGEFEPAQGARARIALVVGANAAKSLLLGVLGLPLVLLLRASDA